MERLHIPELGNTIGKFLSWLLRHGAEEYNIPIAEGGLIKLADINKYRVMKKMPLLYEKQLGHIFNNNDKGRYDIRDGRDWSAYEFTAATSSAPSTIGPSTSAIATTGGKGEFRGMEIMAHQGHSIPTGITHEVINPRKIGLRYMLHGTQRRCLAKMRALLPFDPDSTAAPREHVHFSPYGWGDQRRNRGAVVRDRADTLVVYDA